MSLNPLNELKRRLDEDTTVLSKRLCLAKNVIQSHHFPTSSKERIISEWLDGLIKKNKLSSTDIKGIVGWLENVDEMTNELKSKLIQVISSYVKKNPIQNEDVESIIQFIENGKMSQQLTVYTDAYLTIVITLLQHIHDDQNIELTQKIFANLSKTYKDSKKKLEFIIKLLEGENLETVFSYLDICEESVINTCQNILFPLSKKSFFVSFLQNLIRKDNIDDLIAEKGDNIQSVLKIMSAFFTFPNGRTVKDDKFLRSFIHIFVSCYRSESQMIFAFYIMVSDALNMTQNYISAAMKMPRIIFDENDDKIKRNLFLNMLEVLLKNEIDLTVRLTDTFGEKISKVEIKKTFMSFLQAVMIGQLKFDGKIDKSTFQIIKTALLLDPVLIEQKLDQILPTVMASKKNNKVIDSYVDVMICLLEILFKLSRGYTFINQILPNLKLTLEAGNTEQFELRQQLKSDLECKVNNKIITGNDIFPQECVDLYGKLTSDLMFRQNKDVLVLLQKDFEEHCLMMLEEGFVSPSIIVMAEVLSSILSSFLHYNKMADHTVPQPVAEEFWECFQTFEKECLGKFGECILKLNYNAPLLVSFLKLSLSVSHLKLLNIKYGNTKLDLPIVDDTLEVLDLSILLPCLNGEQWIAIGSNVQDDEVSMILNNLLIVKTTILKLIAIKNAGTTNLEDTTKTHLVKQIQILPDITRTNIPKLLYSDLSKTQIKQLSKILVKLYLNNDIDIKVSVASIKNKFLLNGLVVETVKVLSKHIENSDNFNKSINNDFNIIDYVKELNINEYFRNYSIDAEYIDTILNIIDLLKNLQIHNLQEKYQLLTIYFLLVVKKCCQAKKIRRSIDNLLLNIFELSPKNPDVYKIFPVDFIFCDDILKLLNLKNKSYNNFILKNILELAVNKVKNDSDVIKNIVDLLVDNKSGQCYSDTKFQISCLVLPFIAKKKKSITVTACKNILNNLQDKLHKQMLESFKNIDYNSLISVTGNTDDSMVVSDGDMATLNAIGAYSLILSRYCDNNPEEIKNIDFLWSGLDFFVRNAIQSIKNIDSNHQHVESSIQLLNVVLRNTKKLDTHVIFKEKDIFLKTIWDSFRMRLPIIKKANMEEINFTIKSVCELISVECFVKDFITDLTSLMDLKAPSIILKENSTEIIAQYNVFKYLTVQCLRANIIGPKCIAMARLMYQHSKTIRFWLQEHYASIDTESIMIDDSIVDLLRIDLDVFAEVILAAKKIQLDYKFLDSIFEQQHLYHAILSSNSLSVKLKMTWTSYFKLFEGTLAVLNSLIVSREELLEDRWPNFMQCYRGLVWSLCEKASSQNVLDKIVEEKLAESAHNIEKLTQSICKRKIHVSRIAAYTVADLCSHIEKTAPTRTVRQHLENSVALLIQASDSTYAMAFLRRALAGAPGQMTLTNLYTMYKRYHKYVGNA